MVIKKYYLERKKIFRKSKNFFDKTDSVVKKKKTNSSSTDLSESAKLNGVLKINNGFTEAEGIKFLFNNLYFLPL